MPNDAQYKKLMKAIEDHENRLSKLEGLFQTKTNVVASKPTIKDFIRSKNPKDTLQKTLSIAYYLEKYEDFPSFNVKDLTKGFRDAKEPLPTNMNDMVNKNIEKHYLMKAEKKKDTKIAWVLTAKGEEYVEKGFEEKK